MRYEIQTPYTSRHNQGSIFNPNALNPLSYSAGEPLLGALQFLGPGNRYFYNTNYHNIAPRFGFSYQAIPKAVIHGGYGIFYPEAVTQLRLRRYGWFHRHNQRQPELERRRDSQSEYQHQQSLGRRNTRRLPATPTARFNKTAMAYGSVFRSRPSPYVQQWLLGVQYAFTPNDQLDVNYIGNRGVRMVGGTGITTS